MSINDSMLHIKAAPASSSSHVSPGGIARAGRNRRTILPLGPDYAADRKYIANSIPFQGVRRRFMEHVQRGEVRHINPDTRPVNPAFTNAVVVTGPVRTVYIGGLDAVNASGEIVGKGDIREQVREVFVNLEGALTTAGAGLEHVVKWNVYVVEGHSFEAGYEVFRGVWGGRPNPPAITAMYVSGLATSDFLVEMDAIAVVPLDSG
jgi:enamine deaminase RidA (YjgF/YER057c/UK114 family)